MTPRRNPIGCVFCPMIVPLLLVRDDDRDVAGAVLDAVARPMARGIQRFAMVPSSTAIVWMRRSSTDDVAARLVLGVGHGALDRLGDAAALPSSA